MSHLNCPLCLEVETEDGYFLIGSPEEVREMIEEAALSIRRVLLCDWTLDESTRVKKLGSDNKIVGYLADKLRNNPLTTQPN